MDTKRKLRSKSFNGLLVVLITLVLSGLAFGQSNYQITVTTGKISNAGTDADVSVKLRGTNGGLTGWIKLYKKGVRDFKEGSTTTYNLGTHNNLRGDIQVAFYVTPRKTVDETWFLGGFNLIKNNSYTNYQSGTDQYINTWIYPAKQSKFYDTGLRSYPVTPASNNLSGIILIPQSDGTFLIKASGDSRSIYDSTEFILVPQSNGTFMLKLKPNVIDNQLVADNQEDCTQFSLRRASNNSFQLVNNCTGEVLRGNGLGNNPVIYQQNGGSIYTVPPKVIPNIIFKNQTDERVEIYSVDDRGKETFQRTLSAGDSGYLQKSDEGNRWRIRRNGTYLGDYVASGNDNQTIFIQNQIKRTVSLVVQRQ